MNDFIWFILALLYDIWWYKDANDEQRSCFWTIVLFIVLCAIAGVILWWVFG